jgi:HSP20 family protein
MATLVRWDPLREIAALQGEMGRFMNLFREGNGTNGTQSWVPALDVWETENDIVYAFDLPGIPEDKISVELENGALSVSAERDRKYEVKEDRFYRFERRHGSFQRTIGLPDNVTEDDISADYHDGVLEVHVKKPQQAQPRRIQIGKSSQATIEGTSSKK